ncbi:septal ring lytic transglycosylase RlpA family protein [Ferrimonas sediminicola]|uniref:Endolytic peptidoglycan transglycosylase RlpA n=1 Tax=Ferrimonas sediminicola TaxID=2569538 RepID=A0A4U1BGD2_9GAMM|nr:septal ring lytic transglycosylase RlpA family protein [Ferrimonas sediminicola]TKB49490.1 septal ring lytic transglycosylase RlpA family protein [Ferrimonas sediminicola]
MSSLKLSLLVTLALVLVAGCSGGRYQISQDRAPSNAPDLGKLEQPRPRYEPPSKQGNRDYVVLGRNYQVMKTASGYREEGTASWYGAKFHGHLTSNGETYDMYGFSAAHKSLPLPTYLRVTNLDNGLSVVVRANDRGPFHGDRLIDLSYAAAFHLGMLKQGTARVRIEALATEPSPAPLLPKAQVNQYLQLTASSNEQALKQLADKLEQQYGVGSRLLLQGGLYKLQLGPIADPFHSREMLETLKASGYPGAFTIYESSASPETFVR